jgi:hypothetical protein
LHASNPVFGAEADPDASPDAERPIIPLIGTANIAIEALPPWPTLPRQKLTEIRSALQHRLDALVPAFLGQLLKSFWILRIAALVSWRRRRQEVLDQAMHVVEEELDKAGQLDPPPPTYWQRFRTWLGLAGAGPQPAKAA